MVRIVLQMEGNKVMATYSDFINLHDSPGGFGDTIGEAVLDLFAYTPERCGEIQSTSNKDYAKCAAEIASLFNSPKVASVIEDRLRKHFA